MKKLVTLRTYYRNYNYEGILFKGIVKEKNIRYRMNYSLKYDKRELHISVRPGVTPEEIDAYIIKTLPGLIKRVEKRRLTLTGLNEDEIYILGEKVKMPDGLTREDYLRSLRKEIVRYYESRVRYYEKLMRITLPYKVRGRMMSSRYGSNSQKTHTICLSLSLYQYSEDCIDSVVVHELAHDKHYNHGKRFYDKLLKYCPSYWLLRKRLIYRIYNESLATDKKIDNTPMEEEDDE